MKQLKKRIQQSLTNGAGFTLIEILVVISIMGFLVTMGISSYMDFNRRQILDQTAKTIVNDLRNIQSKAGAGDKGPTGTCSNPLVGWYFRVGENSKHYDIYGNCGVEFSLISKNLPSNLSFTSPSAGTLIIFKPLSSGVGFPGEVNPAVQTITITIANDNTASTKSIEVTTSGIISIK